MLPILLFVLLIPFISLLPLAIVRHRDSFTVSAIASFIVFILMLFAIYDSYRLGISSLSFSNLYIPELNLSFELSVTQPTLILLLMTSIVFMAASVVGKSFIKDRGTMYNTLFLVAEGSALGVFLSSNLFFFYVFWEICEVMMFFIIFIYGGYNRRYASIKFILYSVLSSLLMLIAILLLYNATTPHTFNIAYIIQDSSSISQSVQFAAMMLFLVSFMIKMPVFPLHSWLPDAHTEAPTTGSMILAGVLLKFGGYGLYLMFLMLPIATQYSHYIFLVFLFSTVYSAYVCVGQSNIKRLIAYTSITDMGLVGVGIAAANSFGYTGAMYLMLSHGIAISLLFLLAGTLYELYGTLEISKIKGVITNFAGMSYLFILGVFAALGIPLTAGFVADITLLIGAVSAFGVFGIAPLFGILIIGAALFWTIERVFFTTSKTAKPYNPLEPEIIYSGIFLMGATVVLGVLPFLLLG